LTTPRISIVTPSFNQGRFLEETILSVLEQDYPDIEYIIIDGGSTDGSLEVIRKYEKYLAFWVSEKDRGQSHALNKGFRRATGEIVGWINSDDILAPGACRKAAEAFARKGDVILVYGDSEDIDCEGRVIRRHHRLPFDRNICLYTAAMIDQPGTFFRLDALRAVNYLDEGLRFYMDWDLWLKLSLKGRFHHINRVQGRFRLHEASKTSLLKGVAEREARMVFERYVGGRLPEPLRRRRHIFYKTKLALTALVHGQPQTIVRKFQDGGFRKVARFARWYMGSLLASADSCVEAPSACGDRGRLRSNGLNGREQ